METVVKLLVNNKTILVIGLLAALVAGLYVYNRILALRATIAAQELKATQDQLEAMNQANKLKDSYISDVSKSRVSIDSFLNDQQQSMERINHDSPVDPDILGPDFFASLYGHK